MSINNRNEIIRLLNNLKLSSFLLNPFIGPNDINASIVLSSMYMMINKYDYPTHYDKHSNGSFVPDIVTYRCPSIYGDIMLDSFDNVRIAENSMDQHIIGIEHFKIGNCSYLSNKKKVVNKLSQYESTLYNKNISIEEIKDFETFECEIIKKISIYDSFREIYSKHVHKMEQYAVNIQSDNLLGHAVHPDGSSHDVQIWFLIECDDCMFINVEGSEIPIFLTGEGKKIIEEVGVPDGLIYYGSTCIYAISKDFLKQIEVQENTIFANPQKQQYLRFENNEWGKVLPSYVKIV